MNIFELLNRESETRNLPFLIIGGHAVNSHGYSRFTHDLDLLVQKHNRSDWIRTLEGNGFALFHDGKNFFAIFLAEILPLATGLDAGE